jgi:hypothetical protein
VHREAALREVPAGVGSTLYFTSCNNAILHLALPNFTIPDVTIWFTWILGMFLSFQIEKFYNDTIRFGNKSEKGDRNLWLNLVRN